MIIKLPFSCNNACSNCPGDRCFTEDWISDEMRKDPKTFFIVGGEPTIQNQVPLCELAEKLVHDVPDCRIVLCTNGRTLAYKDVTKSLVHAGVSNFIIFVQALDELCHDSITQTNKSFDQALRAITRLNRYPVNVTIQLLKSSMREGDKNSCFTEFEKHKSVLYEHHIKANIDKKYRDSVIQIGTTKEFELVCNMTFILRQKILEQFNFEAASITPQWSGNYNLNYLVVEGSTKWFLKVSCMRAHHQRIKCLEYENSLLQFLASRGVATYLPRLTKDQRTYFDAQEKLCSLYTFIDGTPYFNTPTQRELAFCSLLRFHQATESIPPPENSLIEYGFKERLKEASSLLNSYTELATEELQNEQKQLFFASIRELTEELEHKLPFIPTKILHGDFHIQNVLFQDGKAHLLDLQNCVYGPVLYDYAVFLLRFFPREELETAHRAHFARFCKDLDVSVEEQEMLPGLLQFYILKHIIFNIKEHRRINYQNLQEHINILRFAQKLRKAGCRLAAPIPAQTKI